MSEPTITHLCTADNMHPYDCLGDGKCIHCDAKVTENHNPKTCALCNWRTAGDEDPTEGAEKELSDEQIDQFCRWLEKEGYLDSDWYGEEPTVIQRWRSRIEKGRTT